MEELMEPLLTYRTGESNCDDGPFDAALIECEGKPFAEMMNHAWETNLGLARREATARRLVLCWNALRHLSDAEIERMVKHG